MTKADLANEIHEKHGFMKTEAVEVVEMVIEILKTTLAEGKNVKIAGFGTFKVRKKGARKARNIQKDEEIILPPRTVVTFKASSQFKDLVENIESEFTSEE